VKIIVKLMVAAAVFIGGMSAYVPPTYAFGDAPWCAVVNLGTGEMYWDCQYRTVEECVPNVIAGNRGFCNLNPYGPGPSVASAAHPKHHKRYARH
jgi:hypothetical protein